MPNTPPPSIAELTNANLAARDALLHPERYDWESLSPTSKPFRAGDMRGLRLTCRHCGGVVTTASIANDMLICESCGNHLFAVERLVTRKAEEMKTGASEKKAPETNYGWKWKMRWDKLSDFFLLDLRGLTLFVASSFLGGCIHAIHICDVVSFTVYLLITIAATGASVWAHYLHRYGEVVPIKAHKRPHNPALEVTDAESNTLLAQAVLQKNYSRATELIYLGANVNITLNPPHRYQSLAHLPIWDNTERNSKCTLLGIVAANNEWKLVRLMLRYGAQINPASDYSEQICPPIMLAAYAGHKGVVKLLSANGARTEHALPGAAAGGNKSLVSALIARISELPRHVFISCLTSALHAAVHFNRVSVCQILLGHGAETNTLNSDGNSDLIEAIHKHDLELVHLLLQKGAAIDFPADKYGNTPLMAAVDAASRGDLGLFPSPHPDAEAILRLLLQKGAASTSHKHIGTAALRLAKGQPKLTTLLRQYGATDTE